MGRKPGSHWQSSCLSAVITRVTAMIFCVSLLEKEWLGVMNYDHRDQKGKEKQDDVLHEWGN